MPLAEHADSAAGVKSPARGISAPKRDMWSVYQWKFADSDSGSESDGGGAASVSPKKLEREQQLAEAFGKTPGAQKVEAEAEADTSDDGLLTKITFDEDVNICLDAYGRLKTVVSSQTGEAVNFRAASSCVSPNFSKDLRGNKKSGNEGKIKKKHSGAGASSKFEK